MADLVQVVCPVCRGPLTFSSESLKCNQCDNTYAIQEGIPVLLPPLLDDLSAEEAAYHDEFTENPADVHQLTSIRNEYYHDLIRRIAVSNGTGVTLEVGGGSGHDAIAILAAGTNLVETDISLVTLGKSQRRILSKFDGSKSANVQFVCCAVTSLPFPDESFQGSFAIATVHHLRDLITGILEMARVTKFGGTVTFGMEPNATYFRSIKRFRKILCFLTHANPAKGSKADAEMSGFTEKELRNAFDGAELKLKLIVPAWLTLGLLHYGLEFIFRAFRLKNRIHVPEVFERILLGFDKAVFKLPFMKRFCWHWIISGVKQ